MKRIIAVVGFSCACLFTFPTFAADCPGTPAQGFVCSPAGTIATGAVFTSGESERLGSSLALIEGLLDEEKSPDVGGGGSADLTGALSLVVTPFGILADENTRQELGYDSTLYGGLVRLEYRTGPLRAGIGIDASHEDIDFDQAGDAEINEYGLSIFGDFEALTNTFVFGAARYGWSDHDIARTLEPGNVALGETDGRKLGLTSGLRHRRIFDDLFAVGATGAVAWQRTWVDGYEETGGQQLTIATTGGPNLRFEDDVSQSLQSHLSLGVSGVPVPARAFQLIPSAFATYVHEFQDDSRTRVGTIIDPGAAGPTEITFKTNQPDRNYFIVGGALSLLTTERYSGALSYSTILGHSYRSEHTIALRFDWLF